LIDELNKEFGIPGRVDFMAGPGDLSIVRLQSDVSRGDVTLHGGQVIRWAPAGEEPVLWLSERSAFDPSRSIRGGIPICWPWFGDHPIDSQLPAHGFARTSDFSVVRSFANEKKGVGIELSLKDTPSSTPLWPGAFELRLVVTMNASLDVALTMHNRSNDTATYGAALHTYLQVGAASEVKLHGLSKTEYLDKVEDFARKRETATPTIEGEVDRVFLDTTGDCTVDDPVLARRVRVAKRGSRTTVVWNPGPAKARAMTDFDDQGFRDMLCIEAANAFEDRITLAPSESHTLATTISVEHV